MYMLGLFNSLGFMFIETQTPDQRQYMQELAEQYDDNKDKIEQYGLTKEDYVNIKTQKEIPTLIPSQL